MEREKNGGNEVKKGKYNEHKKKNEYTKKDKI